MSKNNAKRLLPALLAVMLCASPVMASGQQDLIDTEQLTQQQITYTTTQVRQGSFIKECTASASTYFPLTYNVSFDQSNAKFVEYTVAEGDEVKAGDVLARFSIETSRVAVTRMERNLARAKEETEAGIREREDAIAALQTELAAETDSYEKEKKNISLKKLKTELEQYRYVQQHSIAQQQEALEEAYWEMENNVLLSPVDGVVMHLTQKKTDEAVAPGETLAVLYCQDVMLLRAGNSSGDLRYNMPVKVTVGRGDQETVLTGQVVAADNAISAGERTGYAYIRLDLLDGGAVELSDPKISAETIRLDDVLLADRSAVIQENGKYYVTKLNGDMVQKRYIQFGLSGTADVWIMSGVEEGETLIVD